MSSLRTAGGTTRFLFLLTTGALASSATLAAGQAPVAPTEIASEDAPVRTESIQPVRIKKTAPPAYPFRARRDYEEGWVELQFMVSPSGKAYEPYVAESVGSKEFEEAALRAIEHFGFEPAMENGRPIDSAVRLKIKFELYGGAGGAREKYISAYRAFGKAVDAGDRAAADAALSTMHITNLYEDAFFGIAQYRYAVRWGTEKDQMVGLRRAIASESDAHYLPKSMFASALDDIFVLETHEHDFAAALDTWKKLQKSGIDPQRLAVLQAAVDRINALRTDDRSFSVSGQIADSTWSLGLLKNSFHVADLMGQIFDVQLFCDKKYVQFKFDPTMDYHVSNQYGLCTLALTGDAGTRFTLIQH